MSPFQIYFIKWKKSFVYLHWKAAQGRLIDCENPKPYKAQTKSNDRKKKKT